MNLFECIVRDNERPSSIPRTLEIKALNKNYARIAVDTQYPDYKLLQVRFLRAIPSPDAEICSKTPKNNISKPLDKP